jgi:hypothetical protein
VMRSPRGERPPSKSSAGHESRSKQL